MAREVELKFAVDPAAVARLMEHPLLRDAVETDEKRLAATYFDTDEEDLRAARIACRIRDEDGRRVLTLKGPGGDATNRNEWEAESAGEAPDLTLLRGAKLPRALNRKNLSDRLRPMFRVEVDRRIWIVRRGESAIEAALDRGWIAAGGRTAPICELELELKSGEARDLFALARALVGDLPLDLDLRAKAQRGFALRDGEDGVVDSTPVAEADPELDFADGFRVMAQACLEPIAINARLLRANREPFALHQTRTAVRRLRALFRIFARHLRDETFDHLSAELKALSHALGAARDLDVAATRFDKHRKTRELVETLAPRREAAYERVLRDLAAPRWRLAMLDLVVWLADGEWTRRRPPKISRGGVGDVVALEFHRWDRRLRKGAEALADLDADERHALRIRAKSFAYVCEIATGLAPRRDRKAHRAYVKALKRFQSALGDLNDARVFGALLDDIGEGASRTALKSATRRQEKRSRSLDQAAAAARDAFLAAPRPFGAD